MVAHIVKWLAPAPLWRQTETSAAALGEPALLRFASDAFMEDLLALLEHDPESVGELRARHETWRDPVGSAQRLEEPIAIEREPRRVIEFARFRLRQTRRALSSSSPAGPASASAGAAPYRLKLYQPAHQRYYLVAANLVCALPGFPDRAVDPGKQERASFVLRRLVPAGSATSELPAMDPARLADWSEHAFVSSPSGASWRAVPSGARGRLAGEEPLPLFPLGFRDGGGHPRRLLAGVVPVARREAYLAAPVEAGAGAGEDVNKSSDPRRLLFVSDVIAPWKSLVATSALARRKADQKPDEDNDETKRLAGAKKLRKTAREQIQTGTWYLLLDFAKLLAAHLPHVLAALLASDPNLLSSERRTEERAVYDALNGLALSGLASELTRADEAVTTVRYAQNDVAPSFGAALALITDANAKYEALLDGAVTSYDREAADAKSAWPGFLFAVADPNLGALLPNVTATGPAPSDAIEALFPRLDRLAELIGAALPPLPPGPQPAVAANARANIDPRDGWFVIRCIYEQPECGKLHPPVVSAPSAPFQLAAFFDPDAPARPIRIGLPIDPTPAGLRKFDKKTFLMVSNVLCGHLDRVKQLSLADLVLSVLPWPFHKDLSVPDGGPCKTGSPELALGMMCSLSLPIITLCALILLMIMVSLFDLIFRWIPYFIVCFPLPGFSGKPKGAQS